MDVFEKLNKAFAGWYESWFGDAVSDLRPKDILRKVIGAMEDNRKEGLDNRMYVPNKYVLELVFDSNEEREYLLAFLDKEEFEAALQRHMSQSKYYVRGPLDFTIEEVICEDDNKPEKLCVKAKWDVRPMAETAPELAAPQQAVPGMPYEEEEYTIPEGDLYEASTVAPPVLNIRHADGSSERFPLAKPVTVIGRSGRSGNDLVIEKDGIMSRRHAQIAIGPDGFSIKDLGSTNGVWVDGKQVAEALLKNGDLIRLGSTEFTFEETGAPQRPQVSAAEGRPRLIIGEEEFRLASEVTIGRALTSDIRLTEHSVDQRHARVFSEDGVQYKIEDLGSESGTMVNDLAVLQGSLVTLRQGDVIRIGEVTLRFEVD